MKRVLIHAEDEIFCEKGWEFQNYYYRDSGKSVPIGTPIGIEFFDVKLDKWRFLLYANILE